ncbi:MAG: hypothetical protein COY68_03175 [Candidatus Levybacteria bacterium CG_4_10_14_0_8_um_filter_35_23]|nr:MAG: hypothetical protein COY68_03175 [Candidatus Levybacteria bacterium CG_4_10_14_0_8_um_filter_35_23]
MAFGAMAVLVHLIWSIAVAMGFAQAWISFVFSVHFLNNPFTVATFNFTTALTLIVVTAIVGYVFGWVFAHVWNWAHKK